MCIEKKGLKSGQIGDSAKQKHHFRASKRRLFHHREMRAFQNATKHLHRQRPQMKLSKAINDRLKDME